MRLFRLLLFSIMALAAFVVPSASAAACSEANIGIKVDGTVLTAGQAVRYTVAGCNNSIGDRFTVQPITAARASDGSLVETGAAPTTTVSRNGATGQFTAAGQFTPISAGRYVIRAYYYQVGQTTHEMKAEAILRIAEPVVQTCPDGSAMPSSGVCPPVVKTCPDGSVIPVSGTCPPVTKTCPDGSVVPVSGSCPTVVKQCDDDITVMVGDNCPTQTEICEDGTVVVEGADCPTITTGEPESTPTPEVDDEPTPTPIADEPDDEPIVEPIGQPSDAVISLTKKAAKHTIKAGKAAKFKLTVKNTSKVTAENVVVCDSLPRKTQYLGSSAKVTFTNGRACVKVGNLTAGASRSFVIKLRVDISAKGRVVNKAKATADNAKAVKASDYVKVIKVMRRVKAPVTG